MPTTTRPAVVTPTVTPGRPKQAVLDANAARLRLLAEVRPPAENRCAHCDTPVVWHLASAPASCTARFHDTPSHPFEVVGSFVFETDVV